LFKDKNRIIAGYEDNRPELINTYKNKHNINNLYVVQSKTVKPIVYPLLAAGGPITFVATKVTKMLFFFLGFFAAQSLYPANQAEPRAVNSCPTSFALWPTLQQIFTMPLLTLKAHLFCLISSEANCKKRDRK
jgi:hypothetical protein